MNLWFRLIYVLLTWRRRSKLTVQDVGRRRFRVWPTDLDVFKHMNNGVFMTLLDVGRYDLALRSGSWQRWKKNGWYPVVVAETVTFRKSLMPWQHFELETKIIGWDDQAFYFEQRFVVGEEIFTKCIVRIRFLKRSIGILSPREVIDDLGGWHGPEPKLPAWITKWAVDTALPKGREPAVSNWD